MGQDPQPVWPHTYDREAAKRARKQMEDASSHSPEQIAAAHELLQQILGPAPGTPVMRPPRPKWYEGGDRVGVDRAGWTPEQHRNFLGPVELGKDLDPQVEAAFDRLSRRYPQAASAVTGLHPLEDLPEAQDPLGTLGLFHPGWGTIQIRTKFRGKPLSFQNIVSVLAHEMSHAVGTSDEIAPYSWIRGKGWENPGPVASYDIGDAMDVAQGDVNLPAPPRTPTNLKHKALIHQMKDK